MKNIVLIGFMGSGKTTVGKRVAAKLHIEFYDTDEAIRRCEKMPVYDLLQKKGKKYFEGAQRFAVSTLAQNENCLISTGGDTVMDEFNLTELKKNGILFWLRASAETVYKNTRHSATRRPGLANATPADIEAMMAERNPYYEQADFVISVDHNDMEKAADEIIEQFEKMKG
ncbi:MAG: shikimate kinase [Ruminococcaceae bacterium]|nr:shikimate kinase [Oscillospiraceae bacterium]